VRVLVACEFSGIVRDAFRARGHDAWSCDLLPTESPIKGYHIIGDALEIVSEFPCDLLIYHWPCTNMCNSGVRWLEENPERVKAMHRDTASFRRLLESPIARIAGENPIPHGRAQRGIGRKYDQIIQPWMFGHMETKATCLWLKNLPPLRPTNLVRDAMFNLPKSQTARTHREPPGPNRWKNRSRTLQGIADAMADQWGTPPPSPQR